MNEPSVIVEYAAEVGEGPTWDPKNNLVYWVDILAGQILTTDFVTRKTEVYTYKEMVGAVAPRQSGGLLAAVESGFAAFDGDWNPSRTLDVLGPGFRMNDAKTDYSGRFWAGSNAIDFSEGQGSLWRLDENWLAREVLAGLTLPNGIGWNPEGSIMYLVDSMRRHILQIPFDSQSSEIVGEPEVFVGPNSFSGFPDGLTVDSRGHLWVAEFGASQVVEITPQGEVCSRTEIPTMQPTSCAFVGPALDRLWVTSAASGLTSATDYYAGSVFEIGDLEAFGIPLTEFCG